ncbi:MAG TPA: relaxase/mobilization nuclease domain-containing protein [Pseudoflavonifractor sp.]|nr:relaxase/mobilization nuclease domain-containing protein [Pseudoflavonifractor sp.]
MAYTKILVIHNRLDKCVDYALDEEKTSLSTAIDYALNRDKTEQTCYESSINCELGSAYADMVETKRRWGRGDRARRGYHIIQSFAPGEVMPDTAHAAGVELARRLLGDRYEVIISTHLNKAHLHNHLVFNSVSFIDGKMYRDNFRDYYGGDGEGIRGTSDAICRTHGLSVIEPEGKGRQYSEWEAEKSGKPTVRELVRRDVDAAIADSYTMKSFWQRLEQVGYSVKRGPNIKNITVRPPWGKKNIRLDGLGEGYTEEAIKARLAAGRSGEEPAFATAEPPPPSAQSWYTPGRRYRVRNGIHYRPHKLRGFRALYFKYLYLLGAIPKRRPRNRAALSLREEIIRFDRYQAQFCYLQKNRIETAAELAMQNDAIQAKIDALSNCRRELYKLRRSRESDTVTEDIETITTKLRALRRELKLCARIEGDLPRVREAVRASVQDRSVTHEKNDKSRPLRHFEAGADVPAGDSREH